jgi:hypothetical protein
MKLGRWSGTTLTVNKQQKLHIITAYRVCNNTITNTNSLSTYSQQHFMLQQLGQPDPNPRKQFIIDMAVFINNLTRDNDDYIVLAIDANETLSETGSDF